MEVNITVNNNEKIIIRIEGHLDTLAAQSLTEQLAPVMEDAGKQITLDFTNLDYISSSGLRVLILLNKKAKEKGGHVTIVGMKENILQIFQIVGFDKIFTINPVDPE